MTKHKIIFGDSRKMNLIKDKSVQLIVTSPPYWQLKDYEAANQIGFNDSYESYINNLNLVWQECYRVLDDGCRMCINIGDQFARSVYYGRYKVIPIRTEIIRFCEALGMDYMGAVIWQKSTTMNTSGGGAVMGSFPYPRNGILKMDYEFILIFKKQGNSPKPTKEQKEQSVLTKEEWKEYFSSHWHFNGARQTEHIAMFPEELPKRLIKMFSFVGETVFDPFLGSGTTSLAAKNNGRNSIGYEINKNFQSIIKNKLCPQQQTLFDSASVDFIQDEDSKQFNFAALPYLFSDPHKIDKKIDVKECQFGSRIDSSHIVKDDLKSVKKILSPEIILLSDNSRIKLAGIKEKKEYRPRAEQFLAEKFHNRKIRLKPAKASLKDQISAYIYLDNRTFVNRHLLRTGYVDLDNDFDVEYEKKFTEDINCGKRMDS